MRVFALSDMHVDFSANSDWLAGLSTADYQDDVLILAGDISDSMKKIESSLTGLSRRFAKVLYVPGNHELWLDRDGGFRDSMAKFEAVVALAANCGASTKTHHAAGLAIVPLFGWYDYSFGRPVAQLRQIWVDFRACRWPSDWTEADVTRAFLDMNADRLDERDSVVISFSHFLPRIDLMPAYIPERHRVLYPILGTSELDKQVRALGSRIHVYGHSHVNRKTEISGVQYINNAFGYPREARYTAKSLLCIYDSSVGDPFRPAQSTMRSGGIA